MEELKTELQKYIDLKDQENAQETPDADKLRYYNEMIDSLEQQIDQASRQQAQDEKINNITLPYDFNDLFGHSQANDVIKELIQQTLRQAASDHNAEITQLQADHNDKLRASADRETQLSRQLDNLQQAHAQLQSEHDTLKQMHAETKAQLDEMTANRDNAAKQLKDAQDEIERLNEQLDDHRKEAAVGARHAYKVTDIQATPKLAAMVESMDQKANRAVNGFYERYPELKPADIPDVQPPEAKELQFRGDEQTPAAESQNDQLPAAETTSGVGEQFQTESEVGGQSELHPSDTGEMVRQASGDLEERVSALEARVKVLEQGVKAVA